MALMSPEWSVDTVRETFFSYFGENQHVRLSSTPVIPVDDPKAPLVHSCLNRFKGTLNGSGRHRTCFSLRCINTRGGDDMIDHFRNNTTYHRFTEILGSWSFGDYFKEEAIGLAFNLLSKKYELPPSRIYATYFIGDTSSCLSSDNDSKNILQKYISEERIVPSTSTADVWMPGETGPCGPCVGFFFDCSDSQDGVGSVMNITDDKFVEICRLVFVEFNRQADDILGPLQAKHVLAGINLECLAAILQNKQSHYDLDVYTDILSNIYYSAGPDIEDYSGKTGAADVDGVDTAYRLLADHIRMIAVANAPHSQLGLGNEGREYFLKCADKQAVQYGHKVLKTKEDAYEVIIDGILVSEADLCPELEGTTMKDRIVQDEVMIYKKTIAELRDQEMPFDMGEKKKKKKKKKDVPTVVWYATRVIEFHGRRTPIILKNMDTRCSLVALCNVLLLGEKIILSLDIKKVSEGHLISLVQSYLLYGDTQLQLSEFNKQVLGVLPKLPGSLYFDVQFASSYGFEQTSETKLFGFLGVPLHHGWLVDPQDVEFGSSIPRSSYFKLSYTVAVYESLQPTRNSRHQKNKGCEDDRFYSDLALDLTGSEALGFISCRMISTFLRGPQLTPYGLSSLHHDLKEREPAVLIWNEKLITISKVEGEIFVLLNDLSLLSSETDAVWERLRQADHEGLFVDCDFVPTDSKIQSILPLMKSERKKMNKKENMSPEILTQEKEKNMNKDREEGRKEDRDDEKIKEKANISGYYPVPETSTSDTPTSFMKPYPERITSAGDRLYLDRGPDAALLPLMKNETKKMNKKEYMGLKILLQEKEKNRNEDIEEDRKEDRDSEKIDKADICNIPGTLDIRPIDFFGRSTHVIHQKDDGPCALIAVCNVLLLKGIIHFESNETKIPIEYLLGIVVSFLEDSVKMKAQSSKKRGEILGVVQKLATGFDVDVIFTRTDGFTETPQSLLIDCLDLSLRHGWIAGDWLSGPAVSFESLTLSANEPDCRHAETAKEFLWGPQLTPTGLVSLNQDVVEDAPCILYWSHHYSTIVKVDGRLLSLVTDSNYLRTRANGGGVCLDSNFRPIYTVVDAAPSGYYPVPETSTSDTPTSFMKPYLERITSDGDGDAALLRENLHGCHFVPGTQSPGSCSYTMGPYLEENISHEMSVPGPQIDPEIWEISLEEFVRMPGNEFSELKTIFADGTSLDIADTTKTGRVLGLDLLKELIFSHNAGLSWNGEFKLSTIFVIGGVRAEIRSPYCDKFCEEAVFNDFVSYISGIVELFRIKGVGLPAFFTHLIKDLSKPPCRPEVCNKLQLEGFQRRLHCFWECALNTLALRSSLARAGLFTGLHRIRRLAPEEVRRNLKAVLSNHLFVDGWRDLVAESGHPVLTKVLRYNPALLDGSNEQAREGESKFRKFGLYKPDADSLSIFPRQVNEHGKSQEDLNKLSELELLSSHYLQGHLPYVLENLLCSDYMTAELWKWLKEVLEDYTRPEVLGRGTLNLCRRVFRNHGPTWNLRLRGRRRGHGVFHGRGRGHGVFRGRGRGHGVFRVRGRGQGVFRGRGRGHSVYRGRGRAHGFRHR